MGFLEDQIKNLEHKENFNHECRKCSNSRLYTDGTYCTFYDFYTEPLNSCENFTLDEFWETKVGY